MPVDVRVERFGALDVTVRNLQGQILRRIPGNAAAVRIELGLIEIVTVFIRFAAGEDAALHFNGAPNQSRCGDAERNVRGILPMMTERRIWVVHARWAMTEGAPSGRWSGRSANVQ